VILALAAALAVPYAGTAACGACHGEIAKSQGGTAHASALKAGADGRWAFGSGVQAITYVSQVDEDSYLEHGLSWYRKADRLHFTPGHEDAKGVRYRTFAADSAIMRCFGCHSTGTVRLAEGRKLQPAEPGVRCEACHGAGGEHAKKPEVGNIRHPGKLDAAAVNNLCGECHRMPPAQGVATNWENPWNTRHQPVYLSQAACFLKSGGQLSCLSCHRAHSDEPMNVEAKCAECHAKPRHVTAVGKQRCVECHMPKVEASEWLAFTNHWIGVYELPLTPRNRLRPRAERTRGGLTPGLRKQVGEVFERGGGFRAIGSVGFFGDR